MNFTQNNSHINNFDGLNSKNSFLKLTSSSIFLNNNTFTNGVFLNNTSIFEIIKCNYSDVNSVYENFSSNNLENEYRMLSSVTN
jgi:hypothetical protein